MPFLLKIWLLSLGCTFLAVSKKWYCYRSRAAVIFVLGITCLLQSDLHFLLKEDAIMAGVDLSFLSFLLSLEHCSRCSNCWHDSEGKSLLTMHLVFSFPSLWIVRFWVAHFSWSSVTTLVRELWPVLNWLGFGIVALLSGKDAHSQVPPGLSGLGMNFMVTGLAIGFSYRWYPTLIIWTLTPYLRLSWFYRSSIRRNGTGTHRYVYCVVVALVGVAHRKNSYQPPMYS